MDRRLRQLTPISDDVDSLVEQYVAETKRDRKRHERYQKSAREKYAKLVEAYDQKVAALRESGIQDVVIDLLVPPMRREFIPAPWSPPPGAKDRMVLQGIPLEKISEILGIDVSEFD